MTADSAAKLLPIIKAFAEGKEIQIWNDFDRNWTTRRNIDFTAAPSCYRIKPTPREWCLVITLLGNHLIRQTRDEADELVKSIGGGEVIHVREVID